MTSTPTGETRKDGADIEERVAAALDPSAYGGARFAVHAVALALSIFAVNHSGLPLITKIALGLAVFLTPWLAFEQWVLRRQLARALGLLATGRGL